MSARARPNGSHSQRCASAPPVDQESRVLGV